MLKLIIVDDEKTTRESLKEFMDWSSLGINRVEIAEDGLSALELAEKLEPDILITDVRMPKMDGIELAAKIREFYPFCRIIFISGYSDKEYLKSAIHLKAVSYIEKPIDLDEVKSVVQHAVSSCVEEYERKKDEEHLKNRLDRSKPFIRQEIVLDLIKGNAVKDKLLKKFEDPFLMQPDNCKFNTICIRLNWEANVDKADKSSTRHEILESFCRSGLYDQNSIIAGITPEDNVALVLSGPYADKLDSNGLPEKILKRLKAISKSRFAATVGTGMAVMTLANLDQSFSQALLTSNRQFYSGSNKIYHNGTNCMKTFVPDKNTFTDLSKMLKRDDREAATDLVKKLTGSIRLAADPDINHIKNIYFNLLLIILESARDRNLIDPADENEKSYIWKEIDDINSLTELSDYILSNIAEFFNRFDNTDSINKKVYEITRYIRENYGNKELSIHSIADSAYFGRSYICSFFKKNTGKTLNEYITEVRIEKAKELLLDSKIKLYDVTTRVGFTDSNYFSTLFKKYVGCTPTEYREKRRI